MNVRSNSDCWSLRNCCRLNSRLMRLSSSSIGMNLHLCVLHDVALYLVLMSKMYFGCAPNTFHHLHKGLLLVFAVLVIQVATMILIWLNDYRMVILAYYVTFAIDHVALTLDMADAMDIDRIFVEKCFRLNWIMCLPFRHWCHHVDMVLLKEFNAIKIHSIWFDLSFTTKTFDLS